MSAPPRRAVKQRPVGRKQVRRTFYNCGEVYNDENQIDMVEVPDFGDSPVAYVRVSGNIKKQTQPYESVGVDVSISLPCYPEGSEIDRAYDICSEWVNAKIQDELDFAYGRDEELNKG